VGECGDPAIARTYCRKHYKRWSRHGDPLAGRILGNDEARFWQKVNKDGPVPECCPDLGPCWLWTGSTTRGYGGLKVKGRVVGAHRFVYELLVGPIPDGKEIDHLCRVHGCVNPTHLEPVVHRENVLRGEGLPAVHVLKTHCPLNHPYDEENTYMIPGRVGRYCRICVSEASRAHKARKRGLVQV